MRIGITGKGLIYLDRINTGGPRSSKELEDWKILIPLGTSSSSYEYIWSWGERFKSWFIPSLKRLLKAGYLELRTDLEKDSIDLSSILEDRVESQESSSLLQSGFRLDVDSFEERLRGGKPDWVYFDNLEGDLGRSLN